MSRNRKDAKTPTTPEEKRARDLRRGFLLAHVVISWVVVFAAHWGKWWSVEYLGTDLGAVYGSDPKAFQAGYVVVASLVAFFFTSYDLVADVDIQWPPLLASAFALGCAGQVTYQRISDVSLVRQLAQEDLLRGRKNPVAAVASANASAAPVTSAGVAAVGSASTAPDEPVFRSSVGWGLQLALLGSFAMSALSVWLTFFARREP